MGKLWMVLVAAVMLMGAGVSTAEAKKACTPAADCCKVCDKGTPCGDTCLPAGKKCTLKAKNCENGKACGDTCIAKTAKCTKRLHCACKKTEICK